MSEQKVRSRATPYIPPQHVVEAIAACTSSLEKLSSQERGHVLARLCHFYHLKPAKLREATSAAPQKKKKEPWKKAWEATQEFKEWQSAKLPLGSELSEEQKVRYAALQRTALAQRAAIKSRFQVGGPHAGADRPNNGPEHSVQGESTAATDIRVTATPLPAFNAAEVSPTISVV